MEKDNKRSPAYLRAKRKVEILKGLYRHAIVFVIINLMLILFRANVFGAGKADFSNLGIYAVAFFWGIGLVSHAIYVFFEINFKINFLRRWEEKKIREFMEDEF